MPVPAELDSHRKVLIVDDDPEVRFCLEKAFRRRYPQWQVQSSATGTEALISIGTSAPHLIVLDMVLPGMDGVEVCRILKAKPETRAIRIIGISGKRELSPRQLKEYAVDAFLLKPLDLVALLDLASELMGAARPGAVALGD